MFSDGWIYPHQQRSCSWLKPRVSVRILFVEEQGGGGTRVLD